MSRKKQITAEELAFIQEYGWGGALQGAAAGAVSGAAIGTTIYPVIGTAIGAAAGALVMGTAGHFAEEESIKAQEEQESLAKSQKAQAEYWGNSANIQSGNWSPMTTMADGGPINEAGAPPQAYQGQSHRGPDGGIPVDKSGNPSATTEEPPIALVEDGEVSYKGYIFSDKLKQKNGKTYAALAKVVMSKYKSRLGKNFENDDEMAQEAMDQEMNTIAQENELARMIKSGSYEGLEEYCKGGRLKRKGAGGILGEFKEKSMSAEKSMFGDELSTTGYLFGDKAEGEIPLQQFQWGGTAKTIEGSAKITKDALAMYTEARDRSQSSINETRIKSDLWNTQMKGRVEALGMEDPSYGLRRFEGGGNLSHAERMQRKKQKEYEDDTKQAATDTYEFAKMADRWAKRIDRLANPKSATVTVPPDYTDYTDEDIASIDAYMQKLEDEPLWEDYKEEIPYESQSNLYGYIPGATNVLRGMFEPAERKVAQDYMQSPTVSARQYRGSESIKDAQRASYNRLRAYNPASPTANAAQRIASDVAMQEQIAKMRESQFNINEQLRGRADAENRAIEARNNQIRMAIDEENAQNRAAKSNMITTGLGQLVQEAQGQRAEDSTNRLINAMYPQYEDKKVFAGTDIPWDDGKQYVLDTIDDSQSNRSARRAAKQAEKDAEVNKRVASNFSNSYNQSLRGFGINPADIFPAEGMDDTEYSLWNMNQTMWNRQPMASGGSLTGTQAILPETQEVLDYNEQLKTQGVVTKPSRSQKRTTRRAIRKDPYFDNYDRKERRTIARAGVDPLDVTPIEGFTDKQFIDFRDKRNADITQMTPASTDVPYGDLANIQPTGQVPAGITAQGLPPIAPDANPIYQKYGQKQIEAAEEFGIDPLDIQAKGPYDQNDFDNWIAARKAQGLSTKEFLESRGQKTVPTPAERIPTTDKFAGKKATEYNPLIHGSRENYEKQFSETSVPVPDIPLDKQPINTPANWAGKIPLAKVAEYEGRVINNETKSNLDAGDIHTMYDDKRTGDMTWDAENPVGHPTIGYGHLVTDAEMKSGRFANGLTEMEARTLLEEDVKKHNAKLYNDAPWLKDQPDDIRAVLEDMAFNMGVGVSDEGSGVLGFVEMIKHLKAGDYTKAAREFRDSDYWKIDHRKDDGTQDDRSLENEKAFLNQIALAKAKKKTKKK